MISKYIYKDKYIPEEKDDRALYTKCMQYIHCIPFMTDKMWTYVVSGISKTDIHMYITQLENTYDIQVPTCKFGSYLYHTLFRYCKTILSIQIDYNCYHLYPYSKEQLMDSIQTDTASLKAFIYFIYETHNIWHTVLNPSINIFPKCNTLIHFEHSKCIRRPIIISPLYKTETVCCKSFIETCKKNHTLCAEEFIKNGILFTPQLTEQVVCSNNLRFIQTMLEQHGMPVYIHLFPKLLVYKQYKTLDFLLKKVEHVQIPFEDCIKYVTNPVEYIQCIDSVCEMYPLYIESIREKVVPILDFYWTYIDVKKHKHVITHYIDSSTCNYRRSLLHQIESHFIDLFVR